LSFCTTTSGRYFCGDDAHFLRAVYPFALHYIKPFEKYKVDPSVTYEHQTVLGIIWKAILYMTPFATLDTILVKKYVGVEPEIWDEKSIHWIQTTRALPHVPPSLFYDDY
jgi:hypothetical protein